MRSTGSKARLASQGGFTLVEALIGIMLTAVAVGAISDTLTGILKRTYIELQVTQATDVSERFAAAFTQSGKTATGWAVYADRASYLANPTGNVATAGNVLVFNDQLADGTAITELFEYDPIAQTLSRYENSVNQQRSILYDVVYSAGWTTVFGQDLGLVQAHWTVQSKYELLDFEAYGQPLRMR
jgi:type II secretory pathway pseudopilin PulG